MIRPGSQTDQTPYNKAVFDVAAAAKYLAVETRANPEQALGAALQMWHAMQPCPHHGPDGFDHNLDDEM